MYLWLLNVVARSTRELILNDMNFAHTRSLCLARLHTQLNFLHLISDNRECKIKTFLKWREWERKCFVEILFHSLRLKISERKNCKLMLKPVALFESFSSPVIPFLWRRQYSESESEIFCSYNEWHTINFTLNGF